MPRPLRYAVYVFAALALVAAAAVAYFAYTFDAKKYTPRIVDIVQEKTGRTLTIAGDVKLSVWPNLGIDTGPLTLSERDGKTTFASVEAAHLALELKPLLSREVVIDGIDIRGAGVRIVRDREGRLNIDDLLGREGPPAAFDIRRVNVTGSRIVYEDLQAGDRYTVADLNAETGRLTKLEPTKVNATFTLVKADAPWQVAATLQSGLVLDPDNERTELRQAALTGEFRRPPETTRFALNAGRATYTRAKLSLDELRAEATLQGTAGTTAFKLAAPRFEREADSYRMPELAFDLNVSRGVTTVRASASAAFDGDLKTERLAFERIDGRVAAESPRLPNRTLTATAQGRAAIDLAKHGFKLELNGAVGESRVAAQIAAAGFASPVYTFQVKVDKLDLDRYSGGAARGQREAKADSLLQPLEDLPATGTLHIGTLRSGDTQMNNVTVVLK